MTRKRARLAESDDDFTNLSGSDASDYADVKPTSTRRTKLSPKNKKKKKGALTETRTRRVRSRNSDENIEADDMEVRGTTSAARAHSRSAHCLSQPELLREALLDWYQGVHAARGMPWRKPFDSSWNAEQRAQRAYEVWVSEIMLQQTQVSTVIPYYNKWMSTFPTIRDLAASDIETVNSLWKGLGYYSRAARLLSGAKTAVKDFNGRLPDNAKEMESRIPGIGRYSAGAICSIAYNECAPVLDGNVHRLLSRVLAIYAPPKSKQTLDVLWAGAAAMVRDASSPGDVNQALIELGSTVCKVAKPTCNACPLRTSCRAHQLQQQGPEKAGSRPDDGTIDSLPTSEAVGSQEVQNSTAPEEGEGSLPDLEDLCTVCVPLPGAAPSVSVFPMRVIKKKAREELDIVNVIEWRAHPTAERWFLLVRRPEGGLLSGLYEFPTMPNVPAPPTSAILRDAPRALLATLLAHPLAVKDGDIGLRIERTAPAGDVLHVFSHIRKTYRVQWILLQGGGPESPALTCQVSGTAAAAPSAIWTPIDSVADANIGTGVMKVWSQACTLWGTRGPAVKRASSRDQSRSAQRAASSKG